MLKFIFNCMIKLNWIELKWIEFIVDICKQKFVAHMIISYKVHVRT